MDWFNLSLMDRGGPVMWVLMLVSLFGFVVFVERALYLHKGQIRTDEFLSGIKNNLRKGRLIEALTVCESTPGPVASVVKAALLRYHESEDRIRMAVQAAALAEIPILERRIGTLAALARIAPLLGLVGTIVGVMDAFFNLGAKGDSYPTFDVMLPGLGEALLTTLAGLIFAIMAHLAHHFLHGRVRALVNDMEYAGHGVMQFMLFDLEGSKGLSTVVESEAKEEGE